MALGLDDYKGPLGRGKESSRVWQELEKLKQEIQNSGLSEDKKQELLSRLSYRSLMSLPDIRNLVDMVRNRFNEYETQQAIENSVEYTAEAAYIARSTRENETIINRFFGEQDPDLLHDEDFKKLITRLSEDRAFNAAMKKAKSPEHVAANLSTGVLRAWNKDHLDEREKGQMLHGLERFSKSKALGPEHKDTLAQLKILLAEGDVSQETFDLAKEGKLFNNMPLLKKRVEVDNKGRLQLYKMAEELIPRNAIEQIETAARKHGINPNGQPLVEVVDALRLRDPKHPSLASVDATMAVVRSGNDAAALMGLLNRPENKALSDAFFHSNTADRVAILDGIRRSAYGAPMNEAQRNAMGLVVDTLRTPKQANQFVRAFEESKAAGNLQAVSGFMQREIAERLEVRAEAGDPNAQKDLANMRNLNEHITGIREIDPKLAERIQIQVRQTAFRGLGEAGNVNYGAMQNTVAAEFARYVKAGENKDPRAVALLAAMENQIGNTSGIQAPAPPPAQASGHAQAATPTPASTPAQAPAQAPAAPPAPAPALSDAARAAAVEGGETLRASGVKKDPGDRGGKEENPLPTGLVAAAAKAPSSARAHA